MTLYDAMTYGDRRCMDCGKSPSLHDGPMEQCAKKQSAWCDPSLSREERISAVACVPEGLGSPRDPCDCSYGLTYYFVGRDRYGFFATRAQCPVCGVAWLAERPSPKWYANFYASGAYRKLVSAYHGRDVMATIREEQEQYAANLGEHLHRHSIKHCPDILDIGGSTGVVSDYILTYDRWIGGTSTIVDPAAEVGSRKATHIQSQFDNWTPEGKHSYELILLCQTIDHLLEPRLCLEKIRGLLASDGLFFVDILDTEQEVTQKGWQQTLKIDHCTYFTDKSARLLLSATGFEIVDSWESAKNHLAYLCKGRDSLTNSASSKGG